MLLYYLYYFKCYMLYCPPIKWWRVDKTILNYHWTNQENQIWVADIFTDSPFRANPLYVKSWPTLMFWLFGGFSRHIILLSYCNLCWILSYCHTRYNMFWIEWYYCYSSTIGIFKQILLKEESLPIIKFNGCLLQKSKLKIPIWAF